MSKPLIIGLVVVGVLVVLGIIIAAVPSSPTPTPSPTIKITPESSPTVEATSESSPLIEGIKGVEATVARVIDGDTIELSTGEKVRYIGVDTPETVDPRTAPQCLGKEASNKNKELVEGKKVTLETDVSDKDKYGRLLRYVYVEGKMVNETIVREGFAKASSYPPDVKYQDKFREAEQSARNNKWGLWSDICNNPSPTPKAATQGTTTKAPAPTKSPSSNVNCSSNTYNCDDFSTCSEAEAVYNACSTDVHGLDRDQDGIPCDNLCQ